MEEGEHSSPILTSEDPQETLIEAVKPIIEDPDQNKPIRDEQPNAETGDAGITEGITIEDTVTEELEQNETNDEEAAETGEDNSLLLQPSYDPEEVEWAYKTLIKHGKVPAQTLIPPVMQLINRHKIEALETHEYDVVKQHEGLLVMLSNYIVQASVDGIDESRKYMLQARENELKEQLKSTKNKWKSRMQAHEDGIEFRMRQVKERHETEVNDFRRKCKDPTFVQKFNKPSKDLITLRRTEKRLALAKNYEEAIKAKARADRLQVVEEQQMQRALETHIQTEFLKLRENQKREMSNLMVFEDQTRAKLQAQRQQELEPIEASIQSMEYKKQEGINKKMAALLSISSNPGNKGSEARSHSSLPTPRTQERLNKFRANQTVEIRYQPFSESALDKLEKVNKKRNALPKLAKTHQPTGRR